MTDKEMTEEIMRLLYQLSKLRDEPIDLDLILSELELEAAS